MLVPVADCPSGPFSLNLLWNRAIAQQRLFGLRHDGLWLHVGTPVVRVGTPFPSLRVENRCHEA